MHEHNLSTVPSTVFARNSTLRSLLSQAGSLVTVIRAMMPEEAVVLTSHGEPSADFDTACKQFIAALPIKKNQDKSWKTVYRLHNTQKRAAERALGQR